MTDETNISTGGGGGNRFTEPLDIKDRFTQFFRPLYYILFDQNGELVANVQEKLQQAGSSKSVESFLSYSVGLGVVVGTLMWVLSTFVTAYILTGVIEIDQLIGISLGSQALVQLAELLRIPILVALTGITVGGISFIMTVAVPYLRLYTSVSTREREINILLPETIDYMFALSVGGMNQVEIMEEVAKSDDTYGEVSREFQIILSNMSNFGTDYHTAIRQRALKTPSEDLTEFLINMLSIVSSGGDLETYLREQRSQFTESAEQAQERELDSIELFGEMYLILSLFPLLVIIVIVLMELTTSLPKIFLQIATYGVIPSIGVLFTVLMLTITSDEVGSGELDYEDSETKTSSTGPLDIGPSKNFDSNMKIFNKIQNKEVQNLYVNIISDPKKFLANYPSATLFLTVPFYVTVISILFINGVIPTTLSGIEQEYVTATLLYVYIPIYMILLPFTVFYEYGRYKNRGITSNLTNNLREVASINDSGQTLLQALQIVGEKRNPKKINKEFEEVYNKVQYGQSMKNALVEFNNKYKTPRLARTVKLIMKAQETSSEITDVLRVASESSKRADNMESKRKTKTMTQVGIVGMTFIIMLGILVVLQNLFIGEIIEIAQSLEDTGQDQFNFDYTIQEINMYFFHAIILQGFSSGLMMGMVRVGSIKACAKYFVAFPTLTLIVWAIIVI